MNHFEKAVDVLDAAVFSGDDLSKAANRDLLKRSAERWLRELAGWEDLESGEDLEAGRAG